MKRARIDVNGIVQGVGFRPFIHKLVKEYGLKGWVKNSSTGVTIELEGDDKKLSGFIADIELKKPKLAVIESVNAEIMDSIEGYEDFKIIKSTHEVERFTLISPDVCICEDCLDELFRQGDRRYKFPFINCTNCGPRFTIIKDIPYDRHKTTMESFPMCSECEKEYADIEDRRYHAQPDCCYECGPELSFLDSQGRLVKGEPIEIAKKYLLEGKIVAVKGLGGFHLACDARDTHAVAELRRRKHRDEKPFALMCRDVETTSKWCEVGEEEREYLEGFRRPIVLLKKRNEMLNYISLDNDYYGVMLPYTPIHYLLMDEGLDTLVMTSGNISDMPIVTKNEEALEVLKGIADGFLIHNRDIHTRCDDSLIRVIEGKEYPIRRSRGYVPFPVKTSSGVGMVLACGAEQKASFAITKDEYVFPSQHIGDLKNLETLEHYEKQIENFEHLFGITPENIVCDLHPDYMSTQYAQERSSREGLALYYVQHHHAHMASCMADNNLEGDVIGVIWDGTGYGLDGTVWGGEFLLGGYKEFVRKGSIRPVILPGGDKAVKEIDRIGFSLIYDSFGEIPEGVEGGNRFEILTRMLKSGVNCPEATSVGRLFDGVAAILGLKDLASYEGQGAVILEGIAVGTEDYYDFNIEKVNGLEIFNWRDMIVSIVSDRNKGVAPGIISAKFMNTLVKMAVEIVEKIASESSVRDVVLSGGVFQNLYLVKKLKSNLEARDFKVYIHSRVATSDEGIAIGQAVILQRGGGIKCV